jgi:hydrogenase-4 component F
MIALVLLLAPPLLASLLALAVRRDTRLVGWAGVVLNGVSLAASTWLCASMLWSEPSSTAASELWRLDALSVLLTLCITGVTFIASVFYPGLDASDHYDGAQIRRFRIFVNAFALTMLLAVTTENVGFMWVMIEATTITSAVVIPLHRTKASVEASWKYLLICSVGIALAFAGTVLAYFDFVSTAGQLADALNWRVLRGTAASLHPELMKLSFAFILVGYGTKAGLAPMHTWLPDAHSEAPAPMSAMMSGVLLAVAMYAVARWKTVVDTTLMSSAFTSSLLLAVGLVSVLIGAASLVIQRHYKRMLAYSSVEHIGLVSVGLALGPLGTFAALLHLGNHAIAKSMAFLLAGRILHRYQTTEIARVSALLRVMPWTGSLFALGVLALIGLPPFGLFVSEFLLVKAAIATGHFWVAAVALLLILVAFVSLLNHLNRMLYGAVPEGVVVGERANWRVITLAGCVGASLVLGIILPWPLVALIDRTVAIVAP